MKKSITTENEPQKREVKVALPLLTSPSFVARIKRAAIFEGMSIECFLKKGIESLLEYSEDQMIFNDAGEAAISTAKARIEATSKEGVL